MAEKSFRNEYESIGTFLILELLALVGFGLGGVSLIFQYAGFIVALVATFFAFKNYSKEDLKPILYVGIPLFLMSLFTSFGKFFETNNFLAKLGSFLSLISFLAIGLSARRMKSFSAKNAVLCIGGGLALIVLISTFATWIQYGFFYPLIHRGAGNYYYDGNLYSIINEMTWLNGFKFVEMSQDYGGLFALLCACALTGLLFLKPKDDKITFIVLSVIGGIGLISIITIPNIPALVFFAISFLAALFYKYLKDNKLAVSIFKYALLVIVGFVVVCVVIAMLNVSASGVHNFIAGNSILNRLFNSNRFMVKINPIFEAALKPFNLFGINTMQYIDGYKISDEAILTNVGIFEVEIIKEGGIFAFIFFLVFLLFAYESFGKYLKQSKDKDHIKVIFLAMLVGFFLYSSLFNDVFPITHSTHSYYPFTRSLPFFLMLFIIGFTILPSGKAEVEFKEEAVVEKKEKKEYVDDDYSFSDVEEEEII